jgi:hypothetical protein
MSRSVTQYSQHQRRKELVGYLDAIDIEMAQHTSKHLLLPILRLCELLIQHCGPVTTELQRLNERIAAARLKLDHSFATEDTGEVEVVR